MAAYHQGYGGHGSKHRGRGPPPQMADPNQLFDDTSGAAPPPQAVYGNQGIDMGFNVNNLFTDPMANVAMTYGSSIATQGKDIVNKEINRFMSINKLKYFFAVDTTYVMKKLALLMFPYTHQGKTHLILLGLWRWCRARRGQRADQPPVRDVVCWWVKTHKCCRSCSQGVSLAAPPPSCTQLLTRMMRPTCRRRACCGSGPRGRCRGFECGWEWRRVMLNWEVRYNRDAPLTPRHDVNAPDLYIPTMAFITYILLAGMALGIQQRFSPEVLGLCASTALVWVIIEVFALLLSLYLVTVQSDLTTFDLLAYSGYKYVGMILSVLSGLIFGTDGYYVTLAWTSCALMYFTVRSLRMKILSTMTADGIGASGSHNSRNRLRMYITLAAAAFQPLIIYWLTSHLVR